MSRIVSRRRRRVETIIPVIVMKPQVNRGPDTTCCRVWERGLRVAGSDFRNGLGERCGIACNFLSVDYRDKMSIAKL